MTPKILVVAPAGARGAKLVIDRVAVGQASKADSLVGYRMSIHKYFCLCVNMQLTWDVERDPDRLLGVELAC